MTLEETYESLLEGINDPGVFKAVFMAGGPGSGKSLAAKKLGFASMGLRDVNSDMAFEKGLKQAGLSLKMPEDEEERRDAVRVHAKAITGKRQTMYVKGRLGLVIDSTARDVKKVLKQKMLLDKLGYETAMVFVNTSLETALDRNRTRERSIPDKIVQDNHKVVRANMGKLQSAFGRANFFIIDNDGDTKDLEKNTTKVFPRLLSWVKKYPDNKMAKAWHGALTMKPTKLAAEFEHPIEFETRLQEREKMKSFKQFTEDAQTDQLKDRQEREKEQLAKKHDAENDKDKLRLTRKSNAQSEGAVSPEVMKTKEKLYKDLKPQRKEFETKYGKDKADDVMHATAMNMAKKHHKISEGRFQTELDRQLQLEYANIGQYMRAMIKKGQQMRRRKASNTKKRMRSMKSGKGLQRKSLEAAGRRKAKDTLTRKMMGGKGWADLTLQQRFNVGKKLKKKSGAIAKLAKKLMPIIKKERMAKKAAMQQKKNKDIKQ
jgi:predicted kinase